MKMIAPILVECNNCSELIEIYLEMECVGSYDRQMGEEVEYEGTIEECCTKCDKEIEVNVSVWEYPVGVVNYSDTKVVGAGLIKEPVYSCFIEDFEDEDI